MYHYYELAIMTHEPRADLLREAERDRLAQLARGRRHQPVIYKAGDALVALGESLIRWGGGRSSVSHEMHRA